MNGTMGPSGTVHPKTNPARKWFLFILFGLIFVIGLVIAAYYLSHSEQSGVSVIRMEGTLVTGLASDGTTIGSEVVGGELRDAADDPMVEAIVLRVNSPGDTRQPLRRSSVTWTMPVQKSRLSYPWAILRPRPPIT